MGESSSMISGLDIISSSDELEVSNSSNESKESKSCNTIGLSWISAELKKNEKLFLLFLLYIHVLVFSVLYYNIYIYGQGEFIVKSTTTASS